MVIVAQIVAALAAALHVMFWVFESVLWSRPAIHQKFGVSSAERAEIVRPMAYNQGFYNLALAIGVLVGVVLVGMDGDQGVVGKTLIIFGAGCMAFAGAVLVSSGARYLRAASIQFVPAALAVILTLLS
jgi:putative membrane protein